MAEIRHGLRTPASSGREPNPTLEAEPEVASEERIAACLRFCAGIPTEVLERQLPLASKQRLSFAELFYLPRALPWLPAVEL